MRGKIARELRQLTRQMFTNRPLVEYEYRDITHGGQVVRKGTTRYLTVSCTRALYQGVKRNWKNHIGVYDVL